MRRRPITKFHPGLERLEEKQLLSANALTGHAAEIKAEGHAAAETNKYHKLPHSFFVHRVTNTNAQVNIKLLPPFLHVLVQNKQPVPGQVYNLLQITVRNGTSQTFTAANGFKVRLNSLPESGGRFAPPNPAFPLLTGNEVWKPGQIIICYILTKKYYPLPQTYGGFQFDLGGKSTTAPPGPSAIYLRLKYNPATFIATLNTVVTGGPGNQGGLGTFFGISNTSINNIVSSNTNRNDFAGHF